MLMADEKTFSSIQAALEDREQTAVEERAAIKMPEIAKTGLVPAIVWHLGVMRQDQPIIFWLGLAALVWNGVTFVIWAVKGIL